MTNERATVTLDSELYERVADRVIESDFDSVDEYVSFTLEELLAELEGTPDERSEEQDEEVRDRLRELGYLD